MSYKEYIKLNTLFVLFNTLNLTVPQIVCTFVEK